MKILRGIGAAALRFVIVGIAVPFVAVSLAPSVSSYVKLPSSAEIWAVFLLFGSVFAVTSFLENAYSKGEYPWLGGKIGGGLAGWGLFYYLFSFIPSGMGSETGAEISATGILVLVLLGVVFSYGYIVLDFYDHRRMRFGKPGTDLTPTPS